MKFLFGLNDAKLVKTSLPFDEVNGQSMVGENPVLVNRGRHFHGVLSGENSCLKNPAGVYQNLPRKRVDVHRVSEMRMQKLVNRVEYTQLPVRRYHKRLDRRVSVQPNKKLTFLMKGTNYSMITK